MTEQILGPGSPTDQLIRRLKKQNKDKEWSLKEKENFIPDSGAHSREYFNKNCYYYNKKDIDTLREKLIEDIEGICGVIFTKKVYDVNVPTIKKIINRRFGI